ncbi:MAG TPA: hypothetical protein VFU36_04440 [Jatrophihabitans sp.]|nr:hypothetical protein [Jatrophihabitans sp.]
MRTPLARLAAPLLLAGALIAPATALVLPTAVAAPQNLTVAAPQNLTPAAGAYEPLNPTRIFDTRTSHPIGSGATVGIPVQGVAGLPASGISAVTVILTVLTPAASGSISVFPSGTTWSGAATVSFGAASTQQNTVTAQLGSDGAVSVRNNSPSAVQLVADAVGYYTAGPAVPGGYQPVPLQRIYDTRAAGSQPLAYGDSVSVPVTGQGAVPASNVSAAAVNLTVLSPAVSGSLSVFPTGTDWDGSATVSFTADHTEQSMLTAQLGSDGTFTVRNNGVAPLQLVIDLAGYYVGGAPPATGGYVPISRDRIFDSRTYDQSTGPFDAGQQRTVPTLGTHSYSNVYSAVQSPDFGVRADAILLTVVSPKQSGSVSVFAGDRTFDGKATVSFTAGRTVQRLVPVRIPPEGPIRIRNNSSGTLSVIADIVGYFAGVQNRLQVASVAAVDPNSLLTDVSCTSASFCMALAGAGNTGGGRAFRYDGSSWSAAFSSNAAQNALSCVSPTFCMGVGGHSVSSYDGTQWSAPDDVAPNEGLTSISCASVSFCVAVSFQGRAYRFNGTGWDTGTVLNAQAETSAVSCPTSTFCMAWADGWYRWNGSQWSGTASNVGRNQISVSCVSSTFCQYGTVGYSAVWNGTSWLSAHAPSNHRVVSVSCPAAFACIVSDELQPSGWDGAEWSMPLIRLNIPDFIHVSCPTLNFCMVIDQKSGYRLDG